MVPYKGEEYGLDIVAGFYVQRYLLEAVAGLPVYFFESATASEANCAWGDVFGKLYSLL